MKTYDCVIPVYNEEQDLEKNITTLHTFLTTQPRRLRLVHRHRG